MKTYEPQIRIRSNCFSSTMYRVILENLATPCSDRWLFVSFILRNSERERCARITRYRFKRSLESSPWFFILFFQREALIPSLYDIYIIYLANLRTLETIERSYFGGCFGLTFTWKNLENNKLPCFPRKLTVWLSRHGVYKAPRRTKCFTLLSSYFSRHPTISTPLPVTRTSSFHPRHFPPAIFISTWSRYSGQITDVDRNPRFDITSFQPREQFRFGVKILGIIPWRNLAEVYEYILLSFDRSFPSFPNGPTFRPSLSSKGKMGNRDSWPPKLSPFCSAGEERHAWVGGDAFASWNPVVIPGWRGRALTRCRLNLLEISRQIPGLYPGFRADYVRHCGRSGLRPYRLPCFRTPVMLFPRISTLTLACLRKYLRHWLQKRSCARLNIRAAVSS